MSPLHLTYKNPHRFPTQTYDDINKTNSSRTFNDYLSFFGADYAAFIEERKGKTRRPLSILDCGAGQGVAMETLLESKFKESIEKMTGISIHAFGRVRDLLEKHKKIDWYLGDALHILPNLSDLYDLITDLWGAYCYSTSRLELITLYHKALKPFGRAFIYLPHMMENELEGQLETLEEEFCRIYPETFRVKRLVLIITKVTRRCPVLPFTSVSIKMSSSVPYLSENESVVGNAWMPKKILYKKCEGGYKLRPLVFSAADQVEGGRDHQRDDAPSAALPKRAQWQSMLQSDT